MTKHTVIRSLATKTEMLGGSLESISALTNKGTTEHFCVGQMVRCIIVTESPEGCYCSSYRYATIDRLAVGTEAEMYGHTTLAQFVVDGVTYIKAVRHLEVV